MQLSANEMKEKMGAVSKWLAQMRAPSVQSKGKPMTIKKLFAFKIDKKNPHAIRDLYGLVGTKHRHQRDDGRYTAVQGRMAAELAENRGEMFLRKQAEAAWQKEVRERKADLVGRGPVCCQCGTSVVVCGEIVAPVCLACYHTICNVKCVAV
jgi:hypothetical protein